MKPKNFLKAFNPTFVINFFKSRAGLAIMAILIALTALAFNPDSVASAVGKLWRGANKPSPTKTGTAKPVARKSMRPPQRKEALPWRRISQVTWPARR